MLNEFRSTYITWDKATSRIYSPVTANASDENGRKLVVQIVNGGQVEDLTGATLHLYWETRDKLHDGLDVFKAVDLKKGEFELSYTTGMLSNKGVLNANLVLVDAVGRVVSERFKITVTEGIDNDAIQSENSFSSLTQALIDISNLEQNYAPRLNDLTAQLQQTTNRIDDIITTPVPTGEIIAQEIIDARQGELNLGVNISEVKSHLAGIDRSIYPIKEYVTSGKNKFNKDKKIYGTYLTTTGAVAPIDGYSTLDYWIPVDAGKPYVAANIRWICLYDASKTLVSRIDRSSISDPFIYTPSQSGYVRLSSYDGATDKYWFDLGYFAQESSYSGYESYKSIINNLTFVDGQKDEIKTIVSNQLALPVKVEKTGENFKLSSDFDGVNEIVINTIRNGSNNGTFKFNGTTVGTDNIHDTIDDITPIYTFIALGAGHGYVFNKVVSSTHDKMPADIGSKWSDGLNTFTLMGINGNELIFAVQYTESDGIVSARIVSIVADLTHVSGATNTSTITRESTTSFQFYPSVKNVSVEYVIDGKPINLDGAYHGKELVINEKYTVLDYKSILDYHQVNIGVAYNPNNIEGILEISNTFIYRDKLKCTTSHSVRSLKKCRIGASGFLQSVKLSLAGHTTMRYLPGVLPKSGVDFSAGVDLATHNTTINYLNADLKEPTKPPAFYVDWLLNGDIKKYGFSMGYIVDKTNSKSSDRLTNCIKYWDMRSTGKSYPTAIDGKVLNPGDYMNFMGFRNYLSPDESLNVVEDSKSLYAYALTESSGLIDKKLDDHIGETATKLQGELTLLSDTIDTNGISLNGVGSGIFRID